MERKNAWLTYDEAQLEELKQLNEGYKDFLSKGKTERECVKIAVQMAKEAGYQDLNEVKSLKPGDKVYAAAMGKMIILYQIGKQPLEQGMNILGAHIDSPRLDLKQNPLYEDTDLAYLDTHYYGGIKKYQYHALHTVLGCCFLLRYRFQMYCFGSHHTDCFPSMARVYAQPHGK